MKAILMSIKPKWVVKILNGEKTIEIRKKFPSDYVGWVYIYCCKQRKNEIGCHINYEKVDGKVVARFWCDKVEDVKFNMDYVFGGLYNTQSYSNEKCFERDCCLSQKELDNYLNKNNNKRDKVGVAIHITKLKIFDKPKELKEFTPRYEDRAGVYYGYPLTRAPQSWCYVEV